VLGVDGDLDVVADSDLGVRRHGAAVGIGQRYLVFARALELPQHGVVSTAFLAQGLDLFGEIFHPRAARRLFRRVALVKPLEIIGQSLVGLLDELPQRIAGEIAILVVDRLDARPVHRQQFAPEQVEPLAQQRELAKHRFERGPIVGSEIGDGLEVRLQRPQQPDDLDVAMAFRFQPAARPNSVEIAVDVEFEQIARRVARPARPLRLDPPKACLGEIEPIDKGVDEADGIVSRRNRPPLRAEAEVGRVRSQKCAPCPILIWRQRFVNPIRPSFRTVCTHSVRAGLGRKLGAFERAPTRPVGWPRGQLRKVTPSNEGIFAECVLRRQPLAPFWRSNRKPFHEGNQGNRPSRSLAIGCPKIH
jgi:hypothetical protein